MSEALPSHVHPSSVRVRLWRSLRPLCVVWLLVGEPHQWQLAEKPHTGDDPDMDDDTVTVMQRFSRQMEPARSRASLAAAVLARLEGG